MTPALFLALTLAGLLLTLAAYPDTAATGLVGLRDTWREVWLIVTCRR